MNAYPDTMEPKRSTRAHTVLSTLHGSQHGRKLTVPKVGIYLRVTYSEGVTLRMAGEIVKALQPLDAEVAFVHHGHVAHAHSILSIVTLAAAPMDRVYVWAVGPDAELAVEILAKAFAGGLGLAGASS